MTLRKGLAPLQSVLLWLTAIGFGLACSATGDAPSSGVAGYGAGAAPPGTGGTAPNAGGTAGTAGPGGTGGIGGIGGAGASGSAGSGGKAGECGDKLVASIRDFTEAHPDFEHFSGFAALLDIVQPQLGSDRKPVYAHSGSTAQTTGPVEFAQWYNDTPGVNVTLPFTFQFVKQASGALVYESTEFFPIDNQGSGNGPVAILLPRNFLFTTEIHTKFSYKGGERFTFRGDDDLWVFVNGRLVIDLGGLHPQLEATADFDMLAPTLGLVKGSTYDMDIFHAERHTFGSNFRIETTIECFTPVPPPQ